MQTMEIQTAEMASRELLLVTDEPSYDGETYVHSSPYEY